MQPNSDFEGNTYDEYWMPFYCFFLVKKYCVILQIITVIFLQPY